MSNVPAPAVIDSAVSQIAGLHDAVTGLRPAEDQASAIDRIQKLEHLKAACAAAQARETAALEQLRYEDEAARGVAKARRGRGLNAEIGLARGVSSSRGSKCLNLASALTTDLANTMAALTEGVISEELAQVVTTETSWLSAADRQAVDKLVANRFGTLGPRRLAAEVKAHAQRLDQAGAVARLARAHSERRVSVRPAPENMAYLSALLPMPQAVAIYASLHRDATTMVGTGETADPADPTCTPRTRDQLMADLLVERATGQLTAGAVPAEVQVVMTDAALFGDDETSAWLTGHGPIPARVVKQWLANDQMQAFLRRVFARPDDHQLVSMESRARAFPLGLRRMVMLRDDRCRAPFCDAPIQDIDHADPARDGGPTSYTNASGLCAGCNQIKENNGWRHRANPNRLTVTTPTGHTYTTDTPGLLGTPPATRVPPDHTTRDGPDDAPPASRITDLNGYRQRTPVITRRVA